MPSFPIDSLPLSTLMTILNERFIDVCYQGQSKNEKNGEEDRTIYDRTTKNWERSENLWKTSVYSKDKQIIRE